MQAHFKEHPLLAETSEGLTNEQVEFYNQMIAPFILREFGFSLEQIVEPLNDFVLPLLRVPVDPGICERQQLVEHTKKTLRQYTEIVFESVNKTSISSFAWNPNEQLAFQTFNE